MKTRYLLILFAIFSSCKDEISNEKYRNENYVFYQEDGKAGIWQKINPDLDITRPKSLSTYFFPNGSRYAELEVIDSFPNRVIKYFNKKDELKRTIKYTNDSIENLTYENGYYESYYSNKGLLKVEGLIKNGMNQGIWKYYRKDGETLKKLSEYINDTINGTNQEFWENGNLKAKSTFYEGEQNGETIHFYETGEKKESNFRKNGVLNGPTKIFYKSGLIKSHRNFWNNKIIDTAKGYYENGQIRVIQIHNLDTITMKESGKEWIYYKNGQIKSFANISNYKLNGKPTFYDENGELIKTNNSEKNMTIDSLKN